MHGKGELNQDDGHYTGQFALGAKHGNGHFTYSHPAIGAALPQPPSAKEVGKLAEKRWYKGEWSEDQQHGRADYSDEYGYLLEDATFERGKLMTQRRPPVIGVKDNLFNNPRWPKTYLPEAVSPSPSGTFPMGEEVFRGAVSRRLPPDPPALSGLDKDSGHATARTQPAHLGLPGVLGSRWA